MTVVVNIPSILRQLTCNLKRVDVKANNVIEVIDQLEKMYPGIKERLVSEDKVHNFINVYVNEEDIRFLDELKTPVKSGDELTILPAVAGG